VDANNISNIPRNDSELLDIPYTDTEPTTPPNFEHIFPEKAQ